MKRFVSFKCFNPTIHLRHGDGNKQWRCFRFWINPEIAQGLISDPELGSRTWGRGRSQARPVAVLLWKRGGFVCEHAFAGVGDGDLGHAEFVRPRDAMLPIKQL